MIDPDDGEPTRLRSLRERTDALVPPEAWTERVMSAVGSPDRRGMPAWWADARGGLWASIAVAAAAVALSLWIEPPRAIVPPLPSLVEVGS